MADERLEVYEGKMTKTLEGSEKRIFDHPRRTCKSTYSG